MVTKRKIGGYTFNAELARVEDELRTIRMLSDRIVRDERMSAADVAKALMRIANANANAQDALNELRKIAGGA